MESLSKYIHVGVVLRATSGYSRTEKSFKWHVDRAEKCVEYGQIRLLINDFGQLSGMVMWAAVSKEIGDRILREGVESLQPDDMKSGNDTWLLELSASGGTLPELLRILRDECLHSTSQVTYFRVRNGRRIAKRIARTDCTSFFRSPVSAAFAAKPYELFY
jgi:hemolysin-activating ACP:hemolysin acyltransferase